jgi:hypothetical protein
MIRRFAFGVCAFALGVANAASSHHKVTLDRPLTIGSTELKAGEYNVEMQGDKAIFKSGKAVIQVPATMGKSEQKYYRTSVVIEGSKLQEIDFEGTTESILFNTNGVSASGTK